MYIFYNRIYIFFYSYIVEDYPTFALLIMKTEIHKLAFYFAFFQIKIYKCTPSCKFARSPLVHINNQRKTTLVTSTTYGGWKLHDSNSKQRGTRIFVYLRCQHMSQHAKPSLSVGIKADCMRINHFDWVINVHRKWEPRADPFCAPIHANVEYM